MAETRSCPSSCSTATAAGRETIKSLRQNLYAGEPDLVLEVGPFASGIADAEIEDILPPEIIIKQLDKWQRAANVPFGDEYKPGSPIVPQIEAWAKKHGVTLTEPGWKPELAKRVKQQLLADGHEKIDTTVLDRWQKLFETLQEARAKADANVAI